MKYLNQKKLSSFLIAGVSGVMLIVASGCNPHRPPAAGRSDPVLGKEYPRISVEDQLEDVLLFGPPVVDQGTGQPMRVEVPVRAASDKELRVQYKFEFFDPAGHLIRPEMGWRFERLSGRAQTFLQAAALDGHAVEWRLRVRETR